MRYGGLDSAYGEYEERQIHPFMDIVKGFNKNKSIVGWLGVGLIFALAYLGKSNPELTKTIVWIIVGMVVIIFIATSMSKEEKEISDKEAKAIIYNDLKEKKEKESTEFNNMKGDIFLDGTSGMQEIDDIDHRKYVGFHFKEDNGKKTYYLACLRPDGNILGYDLIGAPYFGSQDTPSVKFFIPSRYLKDRDYERGFK